jgi:hypothetical protein
MSELISARWGFDKTWVDVTRRLKEIIAKGEALDAKPINLRDSPVDLPLDPTPRYPKYLILEFSDRPRIVIQENDPISVPVSPPLVSDEDFRQQILAHTEKPLLDDAQLTRLNLLVGSRHYRSISERVHGDSQTTIERRRLVSIVQHNYECRGRNNFPGPPEIISAFYGVGIRRIERSRHIFQWIGKGAIIYVNIADLGCRDPAPNTPKFLDFEFSDGSRIRLNENDCINEALLKHYSSPNNKNASSISREEMTATVSRPTPQSDVDPISALENSTLSFDATNGQWIKNKVAARIEGLETRTLADYRQDGISNPDRSLGRDKDGRIWRRPGTPTSHPWYLRSSLVKK